MITGVSLLEFIAIVIYMKPIDEHLKIVSHQNPFQHMLKTLVHSNYLLAFVFSTLLVTGGYMLMPFGSAFSVNNLGIPMAQLPILYLVTGIFSMAAGPFLGKLSDVMGKFKVFSLGSILAIVIILYYCNLGLSPFWLVILLNTILMLGVLSRLISSSALITAIPDTNERGAFMSINSSVQQLSGGIASVVAGLIVVQNGNGKLLHYDTIGYIVAASIIVTIIMMRSINKYVMQKSLLQGVSQAFPENNLSIPIQDPIEAGR
jgi:predicted MFS family arabinose efflux permease